MSPELKKILTLTPYQTAAFLLGSILLLVATHYNMIEHRLMQSTTLSTQDLAGSLEFYYEYLSRSDTAQYVIFGLFWGAIGLLAYTALWVLGNVYVELRNFIFYQKYYTKKPSFLSRLKYFLFSVLLALMVIGTVIISIYYGLPLWLNMFTLLVTIEPWTWLSLVYGLGSVIGLTLNMYIIFVFYRFFSAVS